MALQECASAQLPMGHHGLGCRYVLQARVMETFMISARQFRNIKTIQRNAIQHFRRLESLYDQVSVLNYKSCIR